MGDETTPNFSNKITSYKGQIPGTFSNGYKTVTTPDLTYNKPPRVGGEISSETQEIIRLGREAKKIGIKINDGQIELPAEYVDEDQENQKKILLKLMPLFAKYKILEKDLSNLFSTNIDQSTKTELINENSTIEKKIEELTESPDEESLIELENKIKEVEERVAKINSDLKIEEAIPIAEEPKVEHTEQVDVKPEIIEESPVWGVLDVFPPNILKGDGKFYKKTAFGEEELPDQKIWEQEENAFKQVSGKYLDFMESGDTKKKAELKKLIGLKNEMLDAMSSGDIQLAIIKRDSFSKELNSTTNSWVGQETFSKIVNDLTKEDKSEEMTVEVAPKQEYVTDLYTGKKITVDEWRKTKGVEEEEKRKVSNDMWKKQMMGRARIPGVKNTEAKIAPSTMELHTQVYKPIYDKAATPDTRTYEEKLAEINQEEKPTKLASQDGVIAKPENIPETPMAVRGSTIETDINREEKLNSVASLVKTTGNFISDSWKKYFQKEGVTFSLDAKTLNEKIGIKTETWRDSLQEEDKGLVSNLEKTPEEIVAIFVPKYIDAKNPSTFSTLLGMDTYKIMFDYRDINGLTKEQREEVSDLIKKLELAAQITELGGKITERNRVIDIKLIYEGLTLGQLIGTVKSKIAEADKRNNI